jgi:hypothetical protein
MRESYKRGALVAALLADIVFNAWALLEMRRREQAWKRAVAEDAEKAKVPDGVSGD